jgi:predicted ATPase
MLRREEIHFEVCVHDPTNGQIYYTLKIGLENRSNYSVTGETIQYGTENDNLRTVDEGQEPLAPRFLALPNLASKSSQYRVVLDFLKSMRFYEFAIPAMRTFQPKQVGELLRIDGSNIASVFETLQQTDPDRFERVIEYMKQILPGLNTIYSEEIGPSQSIRFQMSNGDLFFPIHMSSGTLLALAVLTALFQPADAVGQRPTLIAIEEPERSLHPAAVGILFDAMIEASQETQIVVTTQSPDLLDRRDVDTESLRVVLFSESETSIGSLSDASRETLRSHLFTAGELIRLDQLGQALPSSQQ